jgi:hypothetical protein
MIIYHLCRNLYYIEKKTAVEKRINSWALLILRRYGWRISKRPLEEESRENVYVVLNEIKTFYLHWLSTHINIP